MINKRLFPLAAVSMLAAANGFSAEQPAQFEFERPVRLQVNGAVLDSGPKWGHSSPCVVDLDEDGVNDLLVGDFSGTFQYFRNTGKAGEPVYAAGKTLQAGKEKAEVRIYCCIGAQPRFCDLNGDGLRDMISNSYDPGHCYLFPGLPGGELAARQEIVDRSGKPVRANPVQNQDYESFGSFYETVDWENDGDLDLLIGCFDGNLKVRINEGTAREMAFATENCLVESGSQPLKVTAHFCPKVADWDGDGLWDIMAGSDDGSVTWFRNTGSKSAPEFAAGEVLVAGCGSVGYSQEIWDEAQIAPGIRSQVEVTDHNGDGKLDLLVGDFRTAYEFQKDLTATQKEKVKSIIEEGKKLGEEFGKKMQEMRADFVKRYPGNQQTSDEARAEWSKAYQALRESPEAKKMEAEEKVFCEKLRPFLAATHGSGDRSFELAVPHGYVWVYLRK